MSYDRQKEDKRRLIKLYQKTKSRFGSGVYFDEDKKRYIRYYICPSYRPYLKKVSNKKVRKFLKNEEKFYPKGYYKKIYDYWWNLY